jgi:DNA ligase (NAD+)
VVAGVVAEFLASDGGRRLVASLREVGFFLEKEDVPPDESERTLDNWFAGKTFVITGTLADLTRDQARDLVVGLGGKVTGSVSKKTSVLIAGEKAGSKLNKARDLDITILDEAAFRARLAEAGVNDPAAGS